MSRYLPGVRGMGAVSWPEFKARFGPALLDTSALGVGMVAGVAGAKMYAKADLLGDGTAGNGVLGEYAKHGETAVMLLGGTTIALVASQSLDNMPRTKKAVIGFGTAFAAVGLARIVDSLVGRFMPEQKLVLDDINPLSQDSLRGMGYPTPAGNEDTYFNGIGYTDAQLLPPRVPGMPAIERNAPEPSEIAQGALGTVTGGSYIPSPIGTVVGAGYVPAPQVAGMGMSPMAAATLM